jgi:hypothetical protein
VADANALRVKLIRRSEQATERASAIAETEVARAAPARSNPSSVGPRTFRRRRLSGSPHVAWSIEATAPQADYTEKGTRPHVIRPRKVGGVLVFFLPQAGRTVFARSVNHPGNPARPWFAPTLKAGWEGWLRRGLDQVR